ncbi:MULTISPECIES: alkaline phosphatase D family protein [unclassified Aureimonas]|uniref:alkaline phosphatase D family protein n=1 Tax=unclassified Aureimonas TaxID=2615206 RepID=UPI0006FCEEEC|nr:MULTISPECIES: alkaline phosphatase D family protein [unclassified Aureimonas]KQT66033.1 hypothetical protein ASG62_21215 [Aureimonas sp. Leaf427]KQT73391.1 hypothetical protein ASG54_17695 [Aureimonas sp. Leaf460]
MSAASNPAPAAAGPLLLSRGADAATAKLTALLALPTGEPAPDLVPEGGAPVAARKLADLFGRTLHAYDFALPVRPGLAAYDLGGRRHAVATGFEGDVRCAFVSCNGQENGDGDRDLTERDLMWDRLAGENEARPFHLLLQGGDQLYADEILHSHPDLRRWEELPVSKKGSVPFTEEMRQAARAYLAGRYLALMAQPAIARLVARVPSLMMWDDHDIIDGWGSHPEPLLDSPVGRGIFQVSREMFLLFQQGCRPDEAPALALDRTGASFSLAAHFPGLSVVAPDLRSERRPDRVMNETGWAAHEAALAAAPEGNHRLILSSVPALGPRLSLVEAALDLLPRAQQYEDDLRDQWQSRAHRGEWRRFLAGLEREMVERGSPVTVVSGEIHLATRAEMQLKDGQVLHQLVASGIAHPRPSKAYAFALGLLARLGDAPLPGRPIRLKALPGRRATYTAERNYLVLERRDGRWAAEWELEDGGRTRAMAI